jgi:hypothetical protein
MQPDRPPGVKNGPAITPGRPITTSSPPSTPRSHASSRLPDGAVSERQRRAVIALSDERDLWFARVYRTWREAYALGRAHGYDAGYLDGIAARKHAQHLLVDVIGAHLARWDGLRRDFGKPRPGDYGGRRS